MIDRVREDDKKRMEVISVQRRELWRCLVYSRGGCVI